MRWHHRSGEQPNTLAVLLGGDSPNVVRSDLAPCTSMKRSATKAGCVRMKTSEAKGEDKIGMKVRIMRKI